MAALFISGLGLGLGSLATVGGGRFTMDPGVVTSAAYHARLGTCACVGVDQLHAETHEGGPVLLWAPNGERTPPLRPHLVAPSHATRNALSDCLLARSPDSEVGYLPECFPTMADREI